MLHHIGLLSVDFFDSVKSGAPRPAFGLNEHQGGIFADERVLSIAFAERGGRNVVEFDGKWVTCTRVKTSGEEGPLLYHTLTLM